MIREHDHVQVTRDFPEWGISKDQIGFVVGYQPQFRVYLVEFDSGLVMALIEEDIKVVHGN